MVHHVQCERLLVEGERGWADFVAEVVDWASLVRDLDVLVVTDHEARLCHLEDVLHLADRADHLASGDVPQALLFVGDGGSLDELGDTPLADAVTAVEDAR